MLLLVFGRHRPQFLHEDGRECESGDDALGGEEVEDELEGNPGDEDHRDSSEEGSRALDQRGDLGDTALLLDVVANVDRDDRADDVVRPTDAVADQEHRHVVLPGDVGQREAHDEHDDRAEEEEGAQEQRPLVVAVHQESHSSAADETAQVDHAGDVALLRLDIAALLREEDGQPEQQSVDAALQAGIPQDVERHTRQAHHRKDTELKPLRAFSNVLLFPRLLPARLCMPLVLGQHRGVQFAPSLLLLRFFFEQKHHEHCDPHGKATSDCKVPHPRDAVLLEEVAETRGDDVAHVRVHRPDAHEHSLLVLLKPVAEDAHHARPAGRLEEAVHAHERRHQHLRKVASQGEDDGEQHVAHTGQQQSCDDVGLQRNAVDDAAQRCHSERVGDEIKRVHDAQELATYLELSFELLLRVRPPLPERVQACIAQKREKKGGRLLPETT